MASAMVPEFWAILCTGFLVGFVLFFVFFRERLTVKGVTALLATAFGGTAFLLFKNSPYIWYYPISLFAGALLAAALYYGGRRQLQQEGMIRLHRIGNYQENFAQPYSSPPNLKIEPGNEDKALFYGGGVSYQETSKTNAGFSVDVSSYTSGTVLRWKARGPRP